MLELSKDPAARYNAIYYGLSVAMPKSDEVIRRLIELAMNDCSSRIVWGLRTERSRIAEFLTPHLDQYKTKPNAALTAYLLLRYVTGQDPPDAQRLADMGEFIVLFFRPGVNRKAGKTQS